MKDDKKIKDDLIGELQSKVAELEGGITVQERFYANEIEKSKEQLQILKVQLEALKKK